MLITGDLLQKTIPMISQKTLPMIGTRINNNDTDSNISNFSTPMSSDEYPHTKSVQIQDARYQFLPVDPRQDTSFQAQLRQRFQGIVPGLEQQPEQQPLAQAPAQPQQPNQAPTQQQQQPNQAPTQQQQQPNQAPAQQQQQPSAQAPAKSQKRTAPATSSQAVQQVIDLTNAERKKKWSSCFNCGCKTE